MFLLLGANFCHHRQNFAGSYKKHIPLIQVPNHHQHQKLQNELKHILP
jgi:hypothetical protein